MHLWLKSLLRLTTPTVSGAVENILSIKYNQASNYYKPGTGDAQDFVARWLAATQGLR